MEEKNSKFRGGQLPVDEKFRGGKKNFSKFPRGTIPLDKNFRGGKENVKIPRGTISVAGDFREGMKKFKNFERENTFLKKIPRSDIICYE